MCFHPIVRRCRNYGPKNDPTKCQGEWAPEIKWRTVDCNMQCRKNQQIRHYNGPYYDEENAAPELRYDDKGICNRCLKEVETLRNQRIAAAKAANKAAGKKPVRNKAGSIPMVTVPGSGVFDLEDTSARLQGSSSAAQSSYAPTTAHLPMQLQHQLQGTDSSGSNVQIRSDSTQYTLMGNWKNLRDALPNQTQEQFTFPSSTTSQFDPYLPAQPPQHPGRASTSADPQISPQQARTSTTRQSNRPASPSTAAAADALVQLSGITSSSNLPHSAGNRRARPATDSRSGSNRSTPEAGSSSQRGQGRKPFKKQTKHS